MENLKKINCFSNVTEDSEFGKITTLTAEYGISAKKSINYKGKSLLANYVDSDDEGLYSLIYSVIDIDGSDENYKEDDGILPTLFHSPALENYVSIIPYHPDKELEISIPIFNREEIVLKKGNRPFVGDFIGISNEYSVFHFADSWSDTKPDKLLSMEFKEGLLKKKHNIKISLPRNNNIFINDNEIHLLAYEDNSWLHRLIDAKGNELQKRSIKLAPQYFKEILNLSFNDDSYLLYNEKGVVTIKTISKSGAITSQELIDIKNSFYNTWIPVKIADDIYVTVFNGEFGNGWFTTKKDKLLEFFYSKDINGFKELVSNKILHMPNDRLIISSVNKTTENNYAVILYPSTERGINNKEVIIINRALKIQS